jgi:RNA polymerase sigma factor (sigma-70 family)
MHELDDIALLRQYSEQNSGEAFATLVTRHIDRVYSVALRHTGNPHSAEEITQAVFVILARKSSRLSKHVILEGWLYETARLTAMTFIRSEIRRARREQEAYMQNILNENEADVWPQIAPLLDSGLAGLNETDRHAVVLRFFYGKSMSEIGTALGSSEDTARMRVNRALEKLRKFFTKRGIASTTATLTGVISANSVQAAPVALAKSVTAVAIAKGAAASGSTLTLIKGALKLMAWTKMQTTIVTAVIIVCVAGGGAGIYAYHSTHLKPAAELQAALHIQKPPTGNWQYPLEQVSSAIFDFGSNRANAFPILEQAVRGSDSEARKQAMAAMGMIVRPAMTKTQIASILLAHPTIPSFVLTSLQSEPATNAVPFLREILFENNDLSSFALSSLHGLFEAKDIPALADLLAQSHNDNSQQKALAHISSASQAQSVMNRANANQQLQRYLPEAIADTISRNPDAVAPFISSVEDLLDDSNADVRFGAACALVKYKGVNDSKISTELTAGLKIKYDTSGPQRNPRVNPEDGLKQLMAIETLQRIGPDAKSMVPAILDYAHSTTDQVLREHAFSIAGQIDSNLRHTMPEVDQALKNDPTLKNATPPQTNH